MGVAVFFVVLLFVYVYQQSKKSKAQSTSQIKQVKLNLKLAFQGIVKDRLLEDKKLKVKVILVDEPSTVEYPFVVDFSYQKESGTWNSFVEISAVDINKKYKFFIKGPMHIQKRICENVPNADAGANNYQCSTGNISLVEGENNFDFKDVILMTGDLPMQDGIVDSADIAKVRQNLGKSDQELLNVADLNLDRVVDTQDYSLAIDGLLIKTDESFELSALTPTPTYTPTPTLGPSSSPTPTGPTPSLSVTPTPSDTANSPTPTPTTTQQGNWGAPFVVGNGGKFIWTHIDDAGKYHLTWGNQDTLTTWYATCTSSQNCNREQVNTMGGETYYPSFAFDPAGKLYMVWEKKVSTNVYNVYFSKYNGSNWSTPYLISNEPYSELASIGVSDNGKIHVVYQSKQGSAGYIYYTSSSDSGTSWSSSVKIGDGLRPRLIVGPDSVHVVWNGPAPGLGIFYKYLKNNAWSSVITISTGHEDQTPDIALDSSDNVHIVWGKYDTNTASYAKIVGTDVRDLKDNVGGSLGLSLWPKVNVDDTNTVHVVFQGKNTANAAWGIYYLKKTAGGNWSQVQTISQTNNDEQVPAVSVYHSKGILSYTDGTNVIARFLQ